jgi:hypothetical protein
MFFQSRKFSTNNFFYIWGPSLLSLFIVMILPYLRGYVIYGRGDTLSHVGFINYILTFSNIGDNGYPLSHILVVALHYVSGIDIYSIVMLLPALFIIFYVILMITLGKTIFKKEYLLYLLIVFIFILKFERIEQFSPFNLSLFLIPLFLYLLYKKNDVPNAILFIIILFAVSFFHIFVSITLVLLTIAFIITKILVRKISKSNIKFIVSDIKSKGSIPKVNSNTLILVSTIVITWATTMYLLQIGSIISWFTIASHGETVLSSNLKVLETANLNIYELLYTIWSKYSITLLFYLSPILLFFILIYKKITLKFEKRTLQLILIFSSFFFFTIIFAFAKDFFSYDRVVRIVVIFSAILMTLFISRLNTKILNKRTLFLILGLILSLMVITSLVTLHKSPITIEPNHQVTMSELDATEWFINYLSYEKLYFMGNNVDIIRFLDANIYRTATVPITSPYYYYKSGPEIPDEFGYNNNTTLAETFNTSKKEPFLTYMMFNKIDIDYHTVFFKRLWDRAKTYSPESFDKLNNDSTANKLYDNGETQSWLIT